MHSIRSSCFRLRERRRIASFESIEEFTAEIIKSKTSTQGSNTPAFLKLYSAILLKGLHETNVTYLKCSASL